MEALMRAYGSGCSRQKKRWMQRSKFKRSCRETHTLGAESKPSGMENRKAGGKYREGRDGRRWAKESFRASGRGDIGTKGQQEKGSNSALQ